MSKALKEAIDANDPGGVQVALKKVKDINRKLAGAKAPLAYACERGADKVLEPLFEAGAIAEQRHTFVDDKPFVIAARAGRLQILKRFLELKKVSNETLEETIEAACFEGWPETLDFLLSETKFSPTIQLFRLASARKNAPTLIGVLLKYSDVNARHATDQAKDITALHELAASGRSDVIRVLLKAGADVNARDEFGRTPLIMLAANLNSIRIANEHAERTRQQLASGEPTLAHGEVPEPVDAREAVRVVLDAGADARIKDHYGNDALDHCNFEFRSDEMAPPKEIVDLLTRAGSLGDESIFALLQAIRSGDVQALRAAIASGGDVNRRTPVPRSYTPLEVAASRRENAALLVRELLKAGADPNLVTRGRGPLIEAAGNGSLDVVKELVSAGAKIHKVYRSGEYIENAYTASEGNEVREYLKALGAENPKYERQTFEPGVASWNDFDELLVKVDVKTVAENLARMIGGTVTLDAYGRSFTPGKKAYVVIRPRGMNWTNIFRIAPPRLWNDRAEPREFAIELAKACKAPVLSVSYSDTADAAAIYRVDPDGKQTEDKGWDFASLKEFVEEMGDEAPEWAKKQLTETDEDDLDSSERLVALAQQEKFVVAAFGFAHAPGGTFELEVRGYDSSSFDSAAFVHTR